MSAPREVLMVLPGRARRRGLALRRGGCVCVLGVGDEVSKCLWRQV